MGHSVKNKLILFLTCIFSIFAVTVAGISTFAWFQQTFSKPENVNPGTITSGSADLNIDGVTGYKYVYDDTGNGVDYGSGHVASYGASGTDVVENINQNAEAVGEDVPLEGVGFYIKGDETFASTLGGGKTPWTFASAVRFEDKYGANKALLNNKHFAVNEKIEIWEYAFTSSDTSALTNITTIASDDSSPSATISDGRITIRQAGDYNIWINSNKEICLDILTPDAVANSIKKNNIKKANNTSTVSVNSLQIWIRVQKYGGSSDQYGNVKYICIPDSSITYNSGYNKADAVNWLNRFYGESGYNTLSTNLKYTATSESDYIKIENKQSINGNHYNHNDSHHFLYLIPPFISKITSFYIGDTSYDQVQSVTWSSNNTVSDTSGTSKRIYCEYWHDSGYSHGTMNISTNGSLSFTLSIYKDTVSYSINNATSVSQSNPSSITKYRFTKYTTANPSASGCTFNGWYLSNSLSGASYSPNSSQEITDTITLYGEFVGATTYYRMYVKKVNFNVSTQSYDSPTDGWDYEITKNTLETLPINTAITGSYTGYDWDGWWYTDVDFANNHKYTTPAVGNTSQPGLKLYAKIVEKKVEITFKLLLKTGQDDYFDGNHYTYDDSNNLNTDKLSGDTANTNTMYWGVTGSFIASSYVTVPTSGSSGTDYPHYTALTYGRGTGNDSETTNNIYNTGATITSDTTLYYKLKESKYTITFNYSYFDVGGNSAFSDANLPATLSGTYYGFNSWDSGDIPLSSVTDVLLTKNVTQGVGNGNSMLHAFRWDENFYTNAACTEAYTGNLTGNTNIYLKMIRRPSLQLFVRKPDNNNNYNNVLNGWTTIKVYAKKVTANWTVSITQNDSDTQKPRLIATYLNVDNVRYYTFEVPDDYYIQLTNNGAFVEERTNENEPNPNGNPNSSLPIDLGDPSAEDSKNVTRGTKNALQLRGGDSSKSDKNTQLDDGSYKCKWHWYGTIQNEYYLVGEYLTEGASSSWTTENGIHMEKGDDTNGFADAKAFAKHIYLSNNAVFKIHNDLGNQWLGFNSVATGETRDYVEAKTDDGNLDHNIKMKTGIQGYFNIYIGKSDNKIYIEDAEKAAYLFFTDVAGEAGSKSYKMGSGDDVYNLAMLEEGLVLQAGDTFAIRNRARAQYNWYAYSALASSSTSLVDSTTTTYATANQVGDTASYLNTTTRLITIKEDGRYKFYLTLNAGTPEIVIKKVADFTPTYGYFITRNDAGTDPDSLTQTSSSIQLRTVSNSKNIAIYTGFHVTTAGKYSLFSTLKFDENTTETTGLKDFHDTCKEKDSNDSAWDTESHDANNNYHGNYVTLKAGYYNIYVYNNGGTYFVSFGRFDNANFFSMNSIRDGISTDNGVYSSNTSMVLRIAFTCSSTSTVNLTVQNKLVAGATNGGLHSHLKYAYIMDPATSDALNHNPYSHIRNTYFDNLATYAENPSLILNGQLTATSSGANQKHYLYILIDYDPDKLGNNNLATQAQLENDFYFIIKATQA